MYAPEIRARSADVCFEAGRGITPLRAKDTVLLKLVAVIFCKGYPVKAKLPTKLKVLDPILWSTLHFSTPLRPNHRRHTFTTAATVCLGCGLSLNITCETYNLHWALGVTCTIEMFVTPSSTHVVLFIH